MTKQEKKKIKSIEAVRYQSIIESIHDSEMKIIEFPTSYKEYDQDQNLIVDSNWDHNGNLSEKITYAFEEGKKVGECVFMDEEEVAEEYTYEYDDEGKVSKAIVKYYDGHEETCTYTYNEEKQIVSKIFVDDEDEEGDREEFEYTDGKIVKYIKNGDFGPEEETSQKWENGLLAEKDQNLILEEEHVWTSFEYNDKKQLIESKEIKDNGQATNLHHYHYNEQGLLETEFQQNGKARHTTQYTYDEMGNETLVEDIMENGNVNYRVKRGYDEDGNVVESSVEMYTPEMMMESQYSVKYTYNFFD